MAAYMQGARRLVEPDVRIRADAEQQQVHSPELGYLALFIGTLLEGIVVVGGDGKILGANRSALDQLDISPAALRMQTLASLFGTSVAAVFDHFRAPLPVPMSLCLPNGRRFHVGMSGSIATVSQR